MQTLDYIIEQLETLVKIPSPSGFTAKIMSYLENISNNFGFQTSFTKKGGLIIEIPGATKETLGISAHVDTLGAMVRSITPSGTLKFSSVGGFTMHSVEGNYCTIHTRAGKEYEGTILSISPSVHVHDDAHSLERTEKNMEIRLDEIVSNKEEVLALGICNGDYISFDPDYKFFSNGYIKSRHLDDKASTAILIGLMRDIKEGIVTPERKIKLLISNHEEVGYGASYLPEDITELIAVDMGVVGDDLDGDEHKVSICAKDSSTIYDYELTSRLIELAKEKKLSYAVDIFPHYGSDVSAALRGGNNIKGALIGPGVQASHSYERTHKDALLQTLLLLEAYI